MYSIQDHFRFIWGRDALLQQAIPATCDCDTNRLFEEGHDLRGAPLPYAVIVDNGVSSSRGLGNHEFFEIRTFFVRIYARSRKELQDISRRFRLVFTNGEGGLTLDGRICRTAVSGGQTTLFPDGVRLAQHLVTVSVSENRGPRRLRING